MRRPAYERGEGVTSANIERIDRLASRLEHVSVDGMDVDLDDAGLALRPAAQPGFWARLTAKTPTSEALYSWQEVTRIEGASAAYVDMDAGLSGTYDGEGAGPAREVNDRLDAPVGASTGEIVWLTLADDGETFDFRHGGASASTLTVREVDGTPSVAATVLEALQSTGLKVTDQTGGVARLENVPASATQVGVVDTSTQTFAGLKQFDDGAYSPAFFRTVKGGLTPPLTSYGAALSLPDTGFNFSSLAGLYWTLDNPADHLVLSLSRDATAGTTAELHLFPPAATGGAVGAAHAAVCVLWDDGTPDNDPHFAIARGAAGAVPTYSRGATAVVSGLTFVGGLYISGSVTGGGSGITSLGGLTGASQTFAAVDETNVTLDVVSSGTTHTFTVGWQGTLATARIADDAVTYPKMQNVSAASKLLGRGSAGGAGDPEEITLGTNLSMSGTTLNAAGSLDIVGLTATSPALDDSLPEYDLSATANRKVTAAKLLGLARNFCGARLTLDANNPNPTTDQSARNEIYLVPYVSDLVYLWDGSDWVPMTISGVGLSLGGLSTGAVYDLFLVISGGVPVIEQLAWTNPTTRATAVTWQDGRLCKATDKARLYLGTFVAASTIACSILHGGAASGGSKAHIGLWNWYHREPRPVFVQDSDTSHTYSSTTIRAWAASSTMRVEAVVGMPCPIDLVGVANVAGNGRFGFGLDTTSAFEARSLMYYTNAGSETPMAAVFRGYVPLGLHYYSLNEVSDSGSTSFKQAPAHNLVSGGINGVIWC